MSPYTDEPTTQELLRLALRELVSQAPLKHRLRSAAPYLMQMDAHDWPEVLQGEIGDIRQLLQTERALRGETAILATIRKLSLQDAEGISKRLIDLSFSLLESVPVPFNDAPPDLAVRVEADPHDEYQNNIIPLFADQQ